MDRMKRKLVSRGNGVVPSRSDMVAAGSWSFPVFCFALLLTAVIVGSMALTGDAKAFFGQ